MWIPPPVLTADLTRKVVFKCHNINNNVQDSDDDTADYVDCGQLWGKVDINILMIYKQYTVKHPY